MCQNTHNMKRRTKWIIGIISALVAILTMGIIYCVAVVMMVVGSQQIFYENGWSMIDDEYEMEMSRLYSSDSNDDQSTIEFDSSESDYSSEE